MIKWFKDVLVELTRIRITLEAQEKHLCKLRECVHSDQRSGSTMKTMGKYL